jgi:nucleoid DNA-binding protein
LIYGKNLRTGEALRIKAAKYPSFAAGSIFEAGNKNGTEHFYFPR